MGKHFFTSRRITPPSNPDNHRAPEPPRLQLTPMEPHLNMHQHNGLFETPLLDTPNGVTPGNPSDAPSRSPSPAPNHRNTSTEWSSAVGHAAVGKSSRVIHNLQEDIARLTRDCSLHRSRAEEAQRLNEALKQQLQNVTDRLRNSEHSHETNSKSIARKDRKIEDLKAEIQNERKRRIQAEEDASKTNHLAAQERDEHTRALTEAQEIARLAQCQYETLSQSRLRDRHEYQSRIAVARKDLEDLCSREAKRQAQLGRFTTIIAQNNREIEAGRDRMDHFSQLFEQYKEDHDDAIRELLERCKQNNVVMDDFASQAKGVIDKMNWAINVKDKVKGAE